MPRPHLPFPLTFSCSRSPHSREGTATAPAPDRSFGTSTVHAAADVCAGDIPSRNLRIAPANVPWALPPRPDHMPPACNLTGDTPLSILPHAPRAAPPAHGQSRAKSCRVPAPHRCAARNAPIAQSAFRDICTDPAPSSGGSIRNSTPPAHIGSGTDGQDFPRPQNP